MICSKASTKKAATLAVRLAQDVLITRIEDVLDNEIAESHADITAKVERALDDKKKQEKWRTEYQVGPNCLIYLNCLIYHISLSPIATM